MKESDEIHDTNLNFQGIQTPFKWKFQIDFCHRHRVQLRPFGRQSIATVIEGKYLNIYLQVQIS